MDKISALVSLLREANAWDTLSHEEVIEQALLEYFYDCTGVVIEFRSSDGKEEPIKKRHLQRTC